MKTPNYRRLTPLFLCLLILLLIAGTWYRNKLWRDKEEQYLSASMTQLETAFQATTNMFFLATATYFDEIINRGDIRQQLIIGMTETGRGKDLARGRLYRQIYPSYERLRQRNLQHLHFHLPDGTSFLRFHRPEYYGDNILDAYPAVRLVIEDKKAIHGFESGKSGAAFRNIFPLLEGNQFIGSVDLSVPFSALHDELKHLLPQREITYVLDRKDAEATLDDRALLYEEAPFHPAFLIENGNPSQPHPRPDLSPAAAEISAKLRRSPDVRERLQQPESFAIKVSIETGSYIVDFLRIVDIENKPVGYLVSFWRAPFLDSLKDEYLIGLAIVWGLSCGLGLLFILLARNHDRMAHLATTDTLTSLPNRRSFMQFLAQEYERFRRYGNPTAVLMLDIDHFKRVNDSYGHAVGDDVLREFSRMLKNSLRQVDQAGRLGGEEFAVLLPDTDREGARQFAERLLGTKTQEQEGMAKGHLFQTSAGQLQITVSIGVACLAEDDNTFDMVLRRADDALYRAKEKGRNQVVAP